MTRKITIYALIILLFATFILSGCGTSNVIDSRVRNALSNSSRSDEAVAWLITNGEMVVPELVNRISNSGGRKAQQAAQALIAMGDYGRQGIIKRFDTMTIDGRQRWCVVLSEQNDKQSVLELLALSEHEGAFDMAVSSLILMGDVAMNYLSGQLHSKYYQIAVDTTLANFGEKAVDLIIPAIHSTNQEKVNRALVILATMGESAVEKLAEDAANNAKNANDAKRIANIMLKNYPESAIIAIMSAINSETKVGVAAALLYEVSGNDNIAQVLMQSLLGDTQAVAKVLQEYVKLCGAEPVLVLAMSGDENIAQGAKHALSGGEYDKQTLTAILNNITDADGAGSKIHNLSNELLTDDRLKLLVQSIITHDENAFVQVAASDMKANEIGDLLSNSAANPVIINRLSSMNDRLQGDNKIAMMKVLASSWDNYIPAIVLNIYAASGENSLLAAKALFLASSVNGKFLFPNIDMLPYASKIIEGLSSQDNIQKSNAQIILSRISSAKKHNEFYKTIFAYHKDRTVFSILAQHYTGAGALPVELSFEKDGQIIKPQTISIKKTGDVKNVSSSKEPNFNSLLTGFASYLGVTLVEDNADVALEFNCDIVPRSKRYSGMMANSYLGAEASGTLTASIGGKNVASAKGSAVILPPDEYPGPSGEFIYKNNAEDAPTSEVYIICFINAMYNLWGEEALFALYNYDFISTNAAMENLFAN